MYYQLGGHISSRFSSNSDVNVLQLLENLEAMFPRCNVDKSNNILVCYPSRIKGALIK